MNCEYFLIKQHEIGDNVECFPSTNGEKIFMIENSSNLLGNFQYFKPVFSEKKMGRVSIESLNADVLLEVFKYLDLTSLKACSLVCHGFVHNSSFLLNFT